MIELAVTDAPGADVRPGILRAIDEYNDSKMGPGNFRLLVIPVHGSDGATIGGLWGYTWARWLFIELLVVPEASIVRSPITKITRRCLAWETTICRRPACRA